MLLPTVKIYVGLSSVTSYARDRGIIYDMMALIMEVMSKVKCDGLPCSKIDVDHKF